MGRKRKVLVSDEGLQLPPCRVCEGPAGGFHYGVNTCEACKGFFHRSSNGNELICENEGNCPVSYMIPKICKKCRYDKCIAVGMAKKAIKTGRYTVEKRTKDILEVKSLQGKGSGLKESSSKNTVKKLDSDYRKSHEMAREVSQQDDRLDIPGHPSSNSNLLHPALHGQTGTATCGKFSHNSSLNRNMSCSPFSIHSLSPSSQVDHLSANSGDISNASSPSLSAPVLKTPGSVSVGKNFSVTPENSGCPSSVCSQCPCAQHIRDLYRDMDRVVEILVQARKEHIEDLLPKFSKEGMEKLAADHKETCHLRQEMFGSMTRLSDKDYDSIYASTGLDADGRMQNYALYNSHMEIYIRAYAKFAKCVPGFNLLDIQDQVTLIKYSRNEFLIFMGFNAVTQGVVHCVDTQMRCKGCADIAGNKEFEAMMDRFMFQRDSVMKLELTLEESIMMTAIVLMAPDRENSVKSERAILIYELLNECLINLLRKRYSEPLQKYAKLVNIMVAYRTFNYDTTKFLKSLRLDKYSDALHNPLLREMFGGIFFDDLEAPDPEVVNSDAHKVKSL